MINKFNTFDDAYIFILDDVLNNYDENNLVCNDEEINRKPKYEKHNYSFYIMNPSLNILKTKSEKRNRMIESYFKKEKVLFDSGDCFGLTKFGNIWKNIANPDGSINANYGHMVYHMKDAGNIKYAPNDDFLSQFEWAKSRLQNRLTCKQAYMHFNRLSHQWANNKDQPCTMFIQFLASKIKDSDNYQLNLCGNMRSNDLVRGTPYNIMYFCVLLHRMVDELLNDYPNLKIGYYYHHTTSLHIYHHDVNLVKKMINGDN